VDVVEGQLPAGDVEIVGGGPEGRPVMVGVEYKTIEDLASCVRSGRFADQLRGMRDYFEVSWLLIEGRWRGLGKDGIEVRKGDIKWYKLPDRVSYGEIVSWCSTMSHAGGVLVWRTENQSESVAWLRAMELWWTTRQWEDHRAHLDWYTPPLQNNPFAGPPSIARRVAALLPGVGNKKSELVAKKFGTIKGLVEAKEAEWLEIPGIGKTLAVKIMKSIREK